MGIRSLVPLFGTILLSTVDGEGSVVSPGRGQDGGGASERYVCDRCMGGAPGDGHGCACV